MRRWNKDSLSYCGLVFQMLCSVVMLTLFVSPSFAEAEGEADVKVDSNKVFMDLISERAKKLAEGEFAVPVNHIPDALLDMNYQQYRAINFKAEHALWRDQSMFELQFFHLGFLYRQPVTLREVSADGVNKRVEFLSEQFDYRNKAQSLKEAAEGNIGFAGFRVHFPLNSEQVKDEVLVFQGASYFRLVGPGQVYGISARGLAVDTALGSGEEFPFFRDFWLMKPEPGAAQLTFYALLDSPSVAGAYRFTLTPGVNTELEVETHLYPRKEIEKLGIAPLTSMFHHGENSSRFFDDFRPEVHDSDGLLMQTSQQEWIWRPLVNPYSLRVVSLSDTNPRGFGLVQRDRDFDNYLDVEAKYNARPSFWVKPLNDWGSGRVELVEIPTESETNDNIVAYWVPQEKIEAGKKYTFQYRLQSFGGRLPEQNLAQVVRTRVGWSALPGTENPPPRKERQFIVDFADAEFKNLPTGISLEPQLQLSSGKVKDLTVTALPNPGQWRVAFKLIPENDDTVDMRLFLTLHNQRLTEVWNYVWSANAIRE